MDTPPSIIPRSYNDKTVTKTILFVSSLLCVCLELIHCVYETVLCCALDKCPHAYVRYSFVWRSRISKNADVELQVAGGVSYVGPNIHLLLQWLSGAIILLAISPAAVVTGTGTWQYRMTTTQQKELLCVFSMYHTVRFSMLISALSGRSALFCQFWGSFI